MGRKCRENFMTDYLVLSSTYIIKSLENYLPYTKAS